MKAKDVIARLPESSGVVVILSGGMDSTIAMRLTVEKYSADKVSALSFDYGQKQKIELLKAVESTELLGVKHKIAQIPFLHECARMVSANVNPDITMPTIQDVLGDPSPPTEVPYRNMVLLSHAAMYAQVTKRETIVCGLQVHDNYSYWDTSQTFVDRMNMIIQMNRMFKPMIIAPFSNLKKDEEIQLLLELDGNVDLLKHTITCYNPDSEGRSCKICPTCSERRRAFFNLNIKDPIPYQ